MKKANYIIFDCETGGLQPVNNTITQIALLTLDTSSLKELNRWETFVKPYNDLSIEKVALETTGLRMSDINEGMDVNSLVNSLIAYFKESSPNGRPENRPVLVGHNVQFDMGFLEYAFNQVGKSCFDYVSPTQLDTMAMSKMVELPSLKLGNCCAEYGIELKNAHSAMPDVVATTELLRHYIKVLRNTDDIKVDSATDKAEKSRVKFQF